MDNVNNKTNCQIELRWVSKHWRITEFIKILRKVNKLQSEPENGGIGKRHYGNYEVHLMMFKANRFT